MQKLFHQSGFAKDMKNLSEETKKEAFLLFMYKIFMNSSSKQDDKEDDRNSQEKSKKSLATDQEELKQLDQIKVKKKLVDYLQVLLVNIILIIYYNYYVNNININQILFFTICYYCRIVILFH